MPVLHCREPESVGAGTTPSIRIELSIRMYITHADRPSHSYTRTHTMASPYVGRSVPSTTTFKDNIFAGKVLFCTGGGSGICNRMVEVRVREWRRLPMTRSRY